MSKEIKPKPYVVQAPDGSIHMVYAPTAPSAIREVREHLKQGQEWEARPATGEELFHAGKTGEFILNAPESISPAKPEPQLDAFPE